MVSLHQQQCTMHNQWPSQATLLVPILHDCQLKLSSDFSADSCCFEEALRSATCVHGHRRQNAICCCVLTGNNTVAPILERAATAFELREAPTQAHVSSRDSGANTERKRLTKPGKKVLHSKPAGRQAIIQQIATSCQHIACCTEH